MEPDHEDSNPTRNSESWIWAGFALAGVVLGALILVSRPGSWFSSSRPAYDPQAQPRLVAERGQLTEDERNAIEVFRTAAPCVVFVASAQARRSPFRLNATEHDEHTGSGFIWDPNGYIITNYHVVANGTTAEVTLTDQSTWKAQRIGADPDKNTAVLKIDAPKERLPPLRLGTSRDLRVGQCVYAIGNPFGYDQTMTAGIISGLGREVQSVTSRAIQGIIQTDARLNPGDSGGPLLDSAGRVIGMSTAILSPTGAYVGIGFALPIDTINRIVPVILRGESVPRPRLGLAPAPDHLVRRLGLSGVLILDVLPHTTAEKAGLRETKRRDDGKMAWGDLIVAVDGQEVQTSDDLFRIIDGHAVGERVRMTILRDGRKLDIDVPLEAMP